MNQSIWRQAKYASRQAFPQLNNKQRRSVALVVYRYARRGQPVPPAEFVLREAFPKPGKK